METSTASATPGVAEEDKLDYIKAILAKLSPEQTKEIHKILLQDPLLKDVPPSADSETISRYIGHESGRAVAIYLVKFTGERIPFFITPETTLRTLKKDIKAVISAKEEKNMGNRKISWKYVWKNYCLMFGNLRLLDDNKRLYEWGIRANDELTFGKYRKDRKDQ